MSVILGLLLPTTSALDLLLLDADWLHDLVLVPGAHSVLVLPEQGASASQEVRQVLRLYQVQKVFLVATTLDSNLLACLLIEEALDDGPDAREKHGRVHYEGLTHDLRVVVAAHLRGQLDQSVDLLGEDLHGATIEIKDVQALLDALTSDC